FQSSEQHALLDFDTFYLSNHSAMLLIHGDLTPRSAEQLRHLFSGQMYNLNPFNILLTPVCKYTFSIKWDNSFYLSKEEMFWTNQQDFKTITKNFQSNISYNKKWMRY